jgi:hypothetical protein
LDDGEQVGAPLVGDLLPAEFNEKAAGALSTIPVDKFVDFLWAGRGMPLGSSGESGATKISSAVSATETAIYEIESVSVRHRAARR